MKKRHFTRQQVVGRCVEIDPKGKENETTHVIGVTLLVDLPCPLWHVDYVKFHKEGTPFEIKTKLTDIYHEEQISNSLILLPTSEKPLPTGCASIAEEDKAMEVAK